MTSKRKFSSSRGYTKKDWDAVSRNPELTRHQIAKGKPFSEAFPDLADSIKRTRGRPRLEDAKQAVTLRILPKTLAKFQASGKDWRTKMARTLDKAKV